MTGKGISVKFKTDGPDYRGADSGCPMATNNLGQPSRCLENCPFPVCVYDMSQAARLDILSRARSRTEVLPPAVN